MAQTTTLERGERGDRGGPHERGSRSDFDWWAARALTRPRLDSKRWQTSIEYLASTERPRAALVRATKHCASKRWIERIFGVDLLVAVAQRRSPIWVEAARHLGRMRQDPREEVRNRAIEMLPKATYRGCTRETALRRYRSSDPLVRVSAAIGFAFERDLDSRSKLARLARDDSRDVREAALISLNLVADDIDNQEIAEVLAECVDDLDPEVSLEAKIGLDARGLAYPPTLALMLRRGYLDKRTLKAAAARRDPEYRPILEALRARVTGDASRGEIRLLDAAIAACSIPS
jgi:hypothetical protein